MSHFKKISLRRQIHKFKASFFELSHLPFNDLFPNDLITQIIERSARSRDKIFAPLVTLKTFVFQVLSDDGSCKQAVTSLLSERLQQGLPANSVNTGPNHFTHIRNTTIEAIITASRLQFSKSAGFSR